MGIFLGDKEIGLINLGALEETEVYCGVLQVYPSYTYELVSVEPQYSQSETQLLASGENYAEIIGTINKKQGRRVVETITTPMILEVTSPYVYVDLSTNQQVYAYDRGTVTGDTATVQVKYSYMSLSGYTYVEVQENIKERKYETTDYEILSSYETLTCDGGTYEVMGRRYFNYWDEWTSGSKTGKQSGYQSERPQSLSCSSSWVTITGAYTFKTSKNTGNERSGTVYAYYDDASDYVGITQYEAAWEDDPEYSVSNFKVVPVSIGAPTYGINNGGTLSLSAQTRTVTHKDGQIIYGSWRTYTGSVVYHFNGTGGNFALSNMAQSQTGRTTLTVPYDNNGWRALVYAKSSNPSATTDLSVVVGINLDVSSTVTFTQKKAEPIISISPTSLTMETPDATTGSLTVTSNVDGWTVSSNQSWLTATKNGNTINLSATKHTGSSNRTATVSVSYGGSVRASATVTQNAISLSVSPTTLTMENISATGILTVTSNATGWTVSTSQSWLTATKSGNKINLSASENKGTSNRTATVSVSYGGSVKASATITQKPCAISIAETLSPDCFRVEGTLPVTTNVTGWTVSSDNEFIYVSKANNTTIRYIIYENSGGARSGNINVSYDGTVRATCSVSQAAGYTFTRITSSDVTITATGKTFTLSVKSQKGSTNVPITRSCVSITGSTLNPVYSTITEAYGGQYNVTFTCTENTSTESSRNATIRITQPGSGKYFDFSITQEAKEKEAIDYVKIYYEAQSQSLNYLYLENTSNRAIDVNSYYYVLAGTKTTSSAMNLLAGEKRLIRGWNPNVQVMGDYKVTSASFK